MISGTHIMIFGNETLQQEFERVAQLRNYGVGEVLMRVGEAISYIPIVRKGSLRILAQDAEGNERFLYHILPGETCAMSLTCCEAARTSSIVAVVEEEAELWMVPAHHADEWMAFREWRRYVGSAQAQRFEELLDTVEKLAFLKMDEQLWDYLVKRAQATGDANLKLTHQAIAQELGSPREVITRLLHQLQRRGLVTLGRGAIKVNMGVPAG